ncbi:MAG: exosortase U [Planctomycetaceae bacterium]|nr:exosortase U [Planctomycetaceae bacterium]
MNIETVSESINKRFSNLPPAIVRFMPVIAWLCLILIHLPLLVVYARDMLSHDYYESLPLLWLVFAAFLIIRTESMQLLSVWRSSFVAGFLLFDACLLFTASWIYSPWLAYIGFVLGSIALLLLCKDRDNGKSLIPLAILLFVAIRLPLSYDTQLINELQLKTSVASSRILNELGCLHYRAGNTLEVGGVNLFVEEACSGVQSLFTLIVCSAFLVVYHRRHWLYATLLFSSAWLWAGLMNTVRVSAIAIAQGWYQYDLTSGWQHDLLGYSCLLLAFLFLLSTDQALYFIMGPIELFRGTKKTLLRSPISTFWNKCFSWKSRIIRTSTRPELNLTQRQIKQITIPPTFAIGFMLLAGFAQAWTTQQITSNKNWSRPASQAAEKVIYPEELLPKQVGDWQIVKFQTKEREHHETWARRSSLWTYRRGSSEVEISLNYPYHGWKRLQECYLGTGWHVTDENVVTDKSDQPWMEFSLANQLGQNQFVSYTMFNLQGVSLSPPEGLSGRVSVFQTRVQRAYKGDVSYMIQALAASHTTLTSPEIKDMRELASQIAADVRLKFKNKNGSVSE